MSEETKTYLVSPTDMQKLADADAVLADLAFAAMMAGDMDVFNQISAVGLPLYDFQQSLVDAGLAEARLDRSDRPEGGE